MDTDAARQPGENPATVYSRRFNELLGLQTREQRREKRLGFAKVVLALVTLISAVFFLRNATVLEFLLAPVAVFVFLAILHERQLETIRLRRRAIHFYERGIARLEDRWAGTGETGERFLEPNHPYARDLDLFGRGSLFELICTARTRSGEETLAAWLRAPAAAEEVRARQAAVEELRDRLALREDLAILGADVRAEV